MTSPSGRLNLPRSTTGREPQYILITLLGDYWYGRPEPLPSAALVGLLAEFSISEGNARQAMRRLTNRDLLDQHKVGRTTFYSVPERIREHRPQRIRRALDFGRPLDDWDGLWTVVAFSIPERMRTKRQLLRSRLKSLHMACLHGAIWVSPHDVVARVEHALQELDIEDATVMRSSIEGPDGAKDWGALFRLDELGEAYRGWAREWKPLLATVSKGGLVGRDALVTRTTVLSEWLSFRVTDPNLPSELLPDAWPRVEAREIALAIYDGLGERAARHFCSVLRRYDRNLADLVVYHTSSGVNRNPFGAAPMDLHEHSGDGVGT
ncbi:PaaX family transcriptional regulator C-terminal domain-containing protein [Intrasporangium sp.]|uniref:PaaX family transcriptional regulator n=1 Tax=Intrasporangium sp. TaxID=1925024 RepID=UPI002939CBB1|nr:PaaX family transcriptional regulator C-terminal domain-containing protein [Intrasporangium sp.]MDV3223296.1 PaaX family transcriptional regulator [Intrasporangium sp.]